MRLAPKERICIIIKVKWYYSVVYLLENWCNYFAQKIVSVISLMPM
ncbi:hypothetical protein GXM_04136 [Nostoc sphaeroides CCNUC1]|uniref:Uncharacterized protein n=1 Tax=Nostoc sphaeroides CCNUC1 TaxID=2653204 RepID=A0A5P8W1Q2_9NOSO|nr:hypothetical protein GXM_04136 [Nostoc sphaeroides CCNUC1]